MLRQAVEGELCPEHIHDFTRLRIDDQDHIVEDDNLIALEDRVDLNHPRWSIIPFDGVRDAAPDLDGEVHLAPAVAMDRAVMEEDAVNSAPLLARNAGEPAVFRTGGPSQFGAASHFSAFAATDSFVSAFAAAQVLALGSSAALTSALLAITLRLAILPGPVVLSCPLPAVALVLRAAIFSPVLFLAVLFSACLSLCLSVLLLFVRGGMAFMLGLGAGLALLGCAAVMLGASLFLFGGSTGLTAMRPANRLTVLRFRFRLMLGRGATPELFSPCEDFIAPLPPDSPERWLLPAVECSAPPVPPPCRSLVCA